MSPETRFIIEVLLAVATGASALVIKLTISQGRGLADDAKKSMEAVADEVKDIARDVKRHGESLAAGNEKFRGMEEKLRTMGEALARIDREGCARGRECLRGGE